MISAGERQSCAVLEDATGAVLGHESPTLSRLLDAGAGPRPWARVAVASSMIHNCALLVSGGVACWGGNDRGQLGDGTNTPSDVPVPVVGLP